MAIYRDNSKVGQPLSTSKPIVTDVTEAVEIGPDGIVERIIERVVHQPVRQKLPRTRRGKTFEFRVADCKGFATIGEYDDGQPGEIFLTVSKQGSTHGRRDGRLRQVGQLRPAVRRADAGVRRGVHQHAVRAGRHDRRPRPAVRHLDHGLPVPPAGARVHDLRRAGRTRHLLGRTNGCSRRCPGVEEAITATSQGSELPPDPKSVPSAGELSTQMQLGLIVPTPEDNTAARGIVRPTTTRPMCMQCGVVMIRSGSCLACPSCGNTSGCS